LKDEGDEEILHSLAAWLPKFSIEIKMKNVADRLRADLSP